MYGVLAVPLDNLTASSADGVLLFKAMTHSKLMLPVNRVRDVALKIAKTLKEDVDMLVVELAALFHDMAAKYTTADTLATTLQPFFATTATTSLLSRVQIDLILNIIPNVSYTNESKLIASESVSEWFKTCPELHAVQDADRLDSIGAVGIFRCAAYSGAKGVLLVHGEEKHSAESHFEEKLLLVKDRMKTAYGREIAERRQQTMLAFLRDLEEEKQLWAEPTRSVPYI